MRRFAPFPFVPSEVEGRSESKRVSLRSTRTEVKMRGKQGYLKIMTRSLIALLAAAVLTGSATAQVRSNTAKAYSDALTKLDDIPRRAALRRAILDSGEKCVRVEKAAYQGPYKNLEMWVATCTGNLRYGAFIGPDGSVQVSECGYLVSLKWPACRKI
jgi:hypothetical protein